MNELAIRTHNRIRFEKTAGELRNGTYSINVLVKQLVFNPGTAALASKVAWGHRRYDDWNRGWDQSTANNRYVHSEGQQRTKESSE